MTRRRSDIIRELADREREAEDYRAAVREIEIEKLQLYPMQPEWSALNHEADAFSRKLRACGMAVTALESELGYMRRDP